MRKPHFKWKEWRLCRIGENLFDLAPSDYLIYKLICEEYYATHVL